MLTKAHQTFTPRSAKGIMVHVHAQGKLHRVQHVNRTGQTQTECASQNTTQPFSTQLNHSTQCVSKLVTEAEDWMTGTHSYVP